jgi:DNA processing protein
MINSTGIADSSLAAVVLAALELAPAEPSDISALLDDARTRDAIARLDALRGAPALLDYLVAQLDVGRIEHWRKVLDRLERDDVAVPVLTGDPRYPRLLAECWDRPPLLFMRGLDLQQDQPVLAMVGSRVAGKDTLRSSRDTARGAAAAGATVVSGLAAGVDTQAHTGALDAGRTVAVLGTGIRHVFPEENGELLGAIERSGTVISQFAPDAPRTGTTFLRRNSVIAGMADVSLVMDGRLRSGSRHQAEQAVRYERQVLLWQPALMHERWAVELAGANANVRFVDDVEEVLSTVLSLRA